MRLAVINCIVLACASVALASEARPKRHLHQIKEMIANKIFGSSASDSSQSQPSEPEVKFFKIPGFDSVVIKAVPKGSEIEPPPIIEKIPPNSHIGIVGSYLGTNNLNETYNALLGVKNLLKSGILDNKHAALEDLTLLQPSKAQYIVSRPLQPCAKTEFIVKPTVEPVRVFLKPPKVPNVVPTQYSYNQVNQDGSLTSYTSYLDLSKGVKVTEKGKTVPFFIDRVQKIPVRLPVPVLPEHSKIIISNPADVGFESFPVEVVHPESSYSYKQVHHGGKLNGDVVITEKRKEILPPPHFLMDRIEKVAATASYPKMPFIDVIQSRPMAIDVPAGHVMYSAPVLRKPVAIPTPGEYAYTQIDGNGGKTTYLASGAFSVIDDPAVFVTKHKLYSPSVNPLPRPDINEHKPSADGSTSFSYNQIYSGAKATEYTRGDAIEYAPVPAVLRELPVPEFYGIPAPNSFSYKQVGNGKVTTYTGSEIAHESPAVIAKSIKHPVPPPHIAERIEKVAAGAKFKRPPILSSPLVSPFAFPVPGSFVRVPSVKPSIPQFPVKIPSASGTSPFLYKHIHSDGSITSFGDDNLINTVGQAPVAMPIPHTLRVFESPVYTGPFPVDVNPNAVKPSTPVSGSYSYKLVNNGQTNGDDMENIDRRLVYIPPAITDINDPFAVPPALPIQTGPVYGFVEPELTNPRVGPTTVMFDEPIPLSYTYKQISHSHPDPFLVVNLDDPVMGVKKINMEPNMNSQEQQLSNSFPAGHSKRNSNGYVYAPSMDTPPQSSFSYKQVTNQGVYEYSDEFQSRVKTNQPPIMAKPQDKPADGVSIDKSPLPSTSSPVLSNRNSLVNNPIVVPEQTSFSFKQRNSDGSTITTIMDNGQSSLSVKVEEASNPDSAQPQEAPKVNSGFEQVTQAPKPVSDQTYETPTPSTESVPPKKKLRRRVVKRVKNRGDIPDTE